MLNDGQQVKPYIAPNAPGLTLEAELGIGENAIPGSDFDVWKLKAIKQPSLERLSDHSYLVHAAAAQPVPHQPQRHRSHIPKGARSGLARSGSRMISVFRIMHSSGKHAPQKHSLHYSAPVFVIAPRADERLCSVPVKQEASCAQTNLTKCCRNRERRGSQNAGKSRARHHHKDQRLAHENPSSASSEFSLRSSRNPASATPIEVPSA